MFLASASLIALPQLPDLHSQQVGKSRGDAELSLSLFVCAHSHSPGTNAFLALSLSQTLYFVYCHRVVVTIQYLAVEA